MKFTKMHGTGNDYVLVNCFAEHVDNPCQVAKAVSDRHFGVGGDGLILVLPSDRAPVRMEMYNADGSRGGMCGNGIRCVAKLAYETGLTSRLDALIDTDDGVKRTECRLVDGKVADVRVEMGRPRFASADVPVLLDGDEVVERSIEVLGGSYRMTCVSMGNPHAVMFVDAIEAIDLSSVGPAFEHLSMFPDRVNAHFVTVLSDERLLMKTWERGSGRTLACGTGACAACVAGVRTGRSKRRVTVDLPGGSLDVEWSDDDQVYMTGPVVTAFEGVWRGASSEPQASARGCEA